METRIPGRVKTIREAVADGSLVDLTEPAKKAGLKCHLFMSPGLVQKAHARSSRELQVYVETIAEGYNFITGYEVFGPIDNGDRIRVLEPHNELGLVLLILDVEQDLNIERTSPDFAQMLC